jgi:hypothetical protein
VGEGGPKRSIFAQSGGIKRVARHGGAGEVAVLGSGAAERCGGPRQSLRRVLRHAGGGGVGPFLGLGVEVAVAATVGHGQADHGRTYARVSWGMGEGTGRQ